MNDVVPMLTYADGPAAMDWLAGAFGFTERMPSVNALMPCSTSGIGKPAT